MRRLETAQAQTLVRMVRGRARIFAVRSHFNNAQKNPGSNARVENYYETVERTRSGFSDLITLTSPPSTSTIALSPALT